MTTMSAADSDRRSPVPMAKPNAELARWHCKKANEIENKQVVVCVVSLEGMQARCKEASKHIKGWHVCSSVTHISVDAELHAAMHAFLDESAQMMASSSHNDMQAQVQFFKNNRSSGRKTRTTWLISYEIWKYFWTIAPPNAAANLFTIADLYNSKRKKDQSVATGLVSIHNALTTVSSFATSRTCQKSR